MVCDRCGKPVRTFFVFYDKDNQDRNHRFGSFCRTCTVELIDELRGKVEWFKIQDGWRGYLVNEARSELEKTGFVHSKYATKYIEIKKTGGKGEQGIDDNLDILRMAYAAGLISQKEYRRRLLGR